MKLTPEELQIARVLIFSVLVAPFVYLMGKGFVLVFVQHNPDGYNWAVGACGYLAVIFILRLIYVAIRNAF